MKFQGYIILTLLVSCLSSTASYGQEKDSVKTAVDDLVILGECCIRQTGLEKDTSTLALEKREYVKLNQNLNRQISNLEQQLKNKSRANKYLADGLKDCLIQLNRQSKKTTGLKIGLITLTPMALIGGILLGSKLSK